MKRLLLSRGMVLALISALAASMVVASVVPQSFMTPAAELARWRGDHAAFARVAEALRLDRVYTHPVFAAVLAVALLALLYSCTEQLRAALRRTFPGAPPPGTVPVELPAPIEAVARALRSRGYLAVRREGPELVLVRHPWGHWGNFLLHAGLAVVAAASTVIGITQQRGVLHLVEGETFRSGGPWFAEQNGVAAARLVLPFSVRLDHLQYRFGPNHEVQGVTSTLSLLRGSGGSELVRVGINDLQQVEGVRIYQGVEMGHAFRLGVDGVGRARAVTLLIQHPETPDAPGVNEYRGLLPGGELLRAKYWVDAERRSFDVFNPLLVVRVDAPGVSLGEAELRPGTEAGIGPYRFRLEKVGLWSRLFFVRITGIGGVFAGFLVISLGAFLHYFTPPREAFLSGTATGATRMVWRASRFASFYAEEYEDLRTALTTGDLRG